MKERPILFSGPMVRAILEGRKTQTRRIVKGAWHDPGGYYQGVEDDGSHWFSCRGVPASFSTTCRHGAPGGRLWVKETWRVIKDYDALIPTFVGKVMGGDVGRCIDYHATPRSDNFWGKTRVSIHMPRWASRLTLEITGVRVERLHDISEADALAEGIVECWPGSFHWERETAMRSGATAVEAYRVLWESINGEGSWTANPFVWVIEFTKL